MSAAVEFDAASHIYSVEGERLPSVTQILQGCGIVDLSGVPVQALDYAAERGTAVHRFCEFLDQGEADWAQIEGTPLEGYCRAYAQFREDTGFSPRLVEHRFSASVHGMRYAGTVDREGDIGGRATVLDLKTGTTEQRSWCVQLAAYALGLRESGRPLRARAALHLRADSSYRLIDYRDPRDEQVWLAALAVETWKGSRHGSTR